MGLFCAAVRRDNGSCRIYVSLALDAKGETLTIVDRGLWQAAGRVSPMET